MTRAPVLPAATEERCPRISNAVDAEVAAAIERVRAYYDCDSPKCYVAYVGLTRDLTHVCAAASRGQP